MNYEFTWRGRRYAVLKWTPGHECAYFPLDGGDINILTDDILKVVSDFVNKDGYANMSLDEYLSKLDF